MKVVTVLWLLTGFHATYCVTVLYQKVLERGNITNCIPVSEEVDNSENTSSNSIATPESVQAKVTCSQNSDCFNGMECKIQDGFGFCSCDPGLSGDRCQVVDDCKNGGKFEKCNVTGGLCKFINGKSACDCDPGKEFDTRIKTCRETCDMDNNKCHFETQCEVHDGYGFCRCPEGLTGDTCRIVTDCELGGKYENCTETGGTCKFIQGKTVCKCGEGKEFDVRAGKCRECDCGYESSCHFDEDGKKRCTCWIEYAENDGQCKECDCSSSLQLGCEFIHGEKKCDCPQFQAQKDGKCVDCFCGPGVNCSFNKNLKKCNCREGFLEDSGYCKECNCGKNGKCSLFFGSKECECDPGFGNRNGFCEVCNCGQNFSCTFTLQWNNYHKSCICPDGFQEVNQYCQEVASTTAVEVISTEENIATTTINPDCDCGEKSYKCFRGSDGAKTCLCHGGYAQLRGKCSDCNCGENSKLCYFDRSLNKTCICSDGYAQRNRTCTAICLSSANCRNGGKCLRGEGGATFCTCRYPFTGEWCEGHSDCAKLDCGAAGATCTVRGNRAECECPPWKWYNRDIGRCEGYSKLWIVSVALFTISAFLMIGFLCYCCIFRRKEKK